MEQKVTRTLMLQRMTQGHEAAMIQAEARAHANGLRKQILLQVKERADMEDESVRLQEAAM